MKLSMHILTDWLEKYHPIAKIETGYQILRSARILSDDIRIARQNVYLAPAREYISGEGDKVICVNGHDLILLDTTDMESVLNDIFEAFDYYNSWSDGLVEDIRSSCSLQHLIDKSETILKFPMAVFDSGHILIAYSMNYPLGSLDAEWDNLLSTHSISMDSMKKLKQHFHNSKFKHGVTELIFSFFNTKSYERMLFHGEHTTGRIILLEYTGIVSLGIQQLLDTFGTIIEHWMSQSRESQLLREESMLFCDLLEQIPVSKEEVNYKLHMVEWEPDHVKQLIQLHLSADYQDLTYPLLYRMEHTFENCYAFLHRQSIYVLANLQHITLAHLEEQMRNIVVSNQTYCAFSYPFTDLFLLSLYARQCNLTLQFCPQSKGQLYHCKDYALDYIHNILSTHVTPAAIHPAWEQLMLNDRQYQNDLCNTLYLYLKNNCNITETAHLLNLHRNSLMYRINKIKELTALNLKNTEVREYLLLSYYVLSENS